MEKGYRLPREGDNVEELLKKIEDFQENFILMRGCGYRWKNNNPNQGRECFFEFTYDELVAPLEENKAVFLMWEDRIDGFPPSLATSTLSGVPAGVLVVVDFVTQKRYHFLTRGSNGEIVQTAEETIDLIQQENDPIFSQWRQEYPNSADEPLTILEIEQLLS